MKRQILFQFINYGYIKIMCIKKVVIDRIGQGYFYRFWKLITLIRTTGENRLDGLVSSGK